MGRMTRLLVFLLPLLLTACLGEWNASPTASPSPPAAEPPATAAAPAVTQTLPLPPTSTATATPAPSPTLPPHPLSIEALRQGNYPGSDVLIEETLEPGANYSRFLASYRSEGLKIYAYLTVPAGDPPPQGWPVIVFNHGYIPPAEYRSTERYVAYVDALARSGYIVFRPDYRGHGFSEGQARGAYSRPDYTIDVLNALASIRRFPGAAPDRVGMWGHSMGGYITLRVMISGQPVRAGVIWAGVVASYADLLTRWRATPPAGLSPGATSWRTRFVEEFGSPEQNPAFWESISANSYLADLSGPLQLHHGTADADVPYFFSEQLADQVRAAGREVEFYGYPGDNHNISENFSLAMQRTIEFFDRALK